MRLYKPTYSKALPAGATKFTSRTGRYKGMKFAKFEDKRGHVGTERLTKDGKKLLVETKLWHIEFEDGLGIRRRLKAYTNKQASRDLADRIQELMDCQADSRPLGDTLARFVERAPYRVQEELVGFGLLDGRSTAAGRPLLEFVGEFEEYLTRKERDPKYVKRVIQALNVIFKKCKFVTWSDISPDRLMNFLDQKRDKGRGISKGRYNCLLETAKRFCRWMEKNRKVVSSPINYLDGLDNPQTDQRHHRRALELNDFRRFLDAAMTGRRKFDLTGSERNFIYRLASETALRSVDLRRLRVRDCDFEERKILIKAGRTKNKQRSFVYLKPATAIELKQYCANKLPHVQIFHLPDKCSMMVQFDLANTKILDDHGNEIVPAIPYVDGNGDFFDFHSLRHQSASLFGMNPDTPEAVRQKLSRHKSPEMVRHYTHASEEQQRSAVNALPDLCLPSKDAKSTVKTGTDSEILSKSCVQDAQIRTNVDTCGNKNRDNVQKTALCVDNEGSENNVLTQVAGSKSCFQDAQVFRNTRFIKVDKSGSKPENPKSCSNLVQNLVQILFSEPELEQLVERWPGLSVETRKIIMLVANR